jgi:nucleotide-binding universal stress UspA family protein
MERIDLERHEESIFPARILLATDGTEEGNVTVRTAVDLARKTGSELHLVYVGKVYRPPYYERPRGYETEEAVETAERAVLDKQVMRVESAGGVVAGAHLKHRWPDQDPAERIVALAEEIEADLIVIRSRGFGGMKRALLGSVSDSVVRHAHCPVLVVRR